MPQLPHFSPPVIPLTSGLLERVEAALAEERKSVAEYLEKRHADILSDLKETSLASTGLSDDGLLASRQNSLQSLQTERMEARQSQTKSNRWSDTWKCHGSGTKSRESGTNNNFRQSDTWQKRPTFIAASGETMTREDVARRLYTKLGYYAMGDWVQAPDLHKCLESLTLQTVDNFKLCQLLSVLHDQYSCSTSRDSQTSYAPSRKVSEFSSISSSIRATISSGTSFTAARPQSWAHPRVVGIQFSMLVDLLCMDALELPVIFESHVAEQIETLQKLLLGADADSLVAELMHLRVDDIAAVEQRATLLDVIEPIIGTAILLNGLLIGLQTVPEIAEHSSTLVADMFISLIFVVEFVLKLYYNGFVKHFCGPELLWNWFDLSIVILAVVDTVLTLAQVGLDTSSMTVVRMARLARLARLVRIFRVSWLSELRLVLLGLVGGLRTLFWSITLLFLIIYVVALFLTISIGGAQSDADDVEDVFSDNFSTLPLAAFTTFRCLLVVECTEKTGRPLLAIVTQRYGGLVPLFYIVMYVFVSIGLMNLIMALYIEATLREAKTENESNKEAQHRQSLRVAMRLKKLLMKISALQATHHKDMRDSEIKVVMDVESSNTLTKQTVDPSLEITKEVFLIAIQDSEIQQIMNDLGIPPERAHLFDVIDANASGQVKPKELLNGLLQIRGELRKTDTAALLLAVRFLQTQFNILDTQIEQRHTELLELLTTSHFPK